MRSDEYVFDASPANPAVRQWFDALAARDEKAWEEERKAFLLY